MLKRPNDVRRSIGLSGQFAAVDEYLTGRENLQMVGELYQLSAADAKRRAGELLERFDLADAADRIAKNYSGGMRRRLDLAAALVVSPPVMFMDEPTTGLDPRNRQMLWDVDQGSGRGRHHAAADHAISGRGRPPGRRDLRHRPRQGDRARHLRRAEGTHRRRAHRDRRAPARSDRVGADGARPVRRGRGDRRRSTPASSPAPVAGGAKLLAEVIRELDDNGVEIDDIALRRPTLDDVFLSLTGHHAEGDDDSEDEPNERE